MNKIRKFPRYEQTVSALLIDAKEAAIAPMRPKMREFDVTERQCRVMRVLNDRGAVDASGLAEIAKLHAPSVTRILKELEARDLVTRQPDPEDRRRTLVMLTPSGKELVKEIARDVRRVMSEFRTRFGDERLETLLAELQAFAAAVKGVQ
ncbi:MAG: MarR family transcriptional regulator [Sphingomonas sp.]|jgi:homoprotocatechuate degradation regulator HpaR|nr:MarR family transcriptional regulator [Sphingomonas sp.]